MTWLAKVRKLSFFSPSCPSLMVLATTSSKSVWPRKRLEKSICPPCGGCGLGRATRELPVGVGRAERDTRTLPPTRLEPLTVGFHQRVRGLLHLLPGRHALPHRLGQGLRHAVPLRDPLSSPEIHIETSAWRTIVPPELPKHT
jgi:hypothetical protein